MLHYENYTITSFLSIFIFFFNLVQHGHTSMSKFVSLIFELLQITWATTLPLLPVLVEWRAVLCGPNTARTRLWSRNDYMETFQGNRVIDEAKRFIVDLFCRNIARAKTTVLRVRALNIFFFSNILRICVPIKPYHRWFGSSRRLH